MEEPQCWNCFFWRTLLWVGRTKCICVGSPYYNQHTSMWSGCDCFAVNPHSQEREDDKKEYHAA